MAATVEVFFPEIVSRVAQKELTLVETALGGDLGSREPTDVGGEGGGTGHLIVSNFLG